MSELLLHLLLELLGFALQHLLLPFLFSRLGAVALLLGEILFAFREFVELFQGVVDCLRPLLGTTGRGLPGLVLIFLGIQLQFEEAGQIAGGATASSAAALGSERNLNSPEGGFGS